MGKLFCGGGATAVPPGREMQGARAPHLVSSPRVPFGCPGTGLVEVGSSAALSLTGGGCPLLPTPGALRRVQPALGRRVADGRAGWPGEAGGERLGATVTHGILGGGRKKSGGARRHCPPRDWVARQGIWTQLCPGTSSQGL